MKSKSKKWRCSWLPIVCGVNEMSKLYQPALGIVVSMGQDDCSQLGISTDNDDEEKLTLYPPTFVRNVTTSMVQVAAGGLHYG